MDACGGLRRLGHREATEGMYVESRKAYERTACGLQVWSCGVRRRSRRLSCDTARLPVVGIRSPSRTVPSRPWHGDIRDWRWDWAGDAPIARPGREPAARDRA